ncbi:MAG TPA: hypothetical protein PK256_06145 [Verrucomicrobiota bacterium]|nr:hypothetical protein [Verrucomicrobiota bacterium]
MRKPRDKLLPPVHELRIASVKATIWRNETDDNRTFYNTTFCRLYRDDEEWKTSESFGRDDLLLLAKVADGAHSWIVQQTQDEHKSAKAAIVHAPANAG